MKVSNYVLSFGKSMELRYMVAQAIAKRDTTTKRLATIALNLYTLEEAPLRMFKTP